jgi:non-specific serine/threonine protein kinase
LEGSSGAENTLYRYRFGEVELDEARFELRVGGLGIDLERKPLLVLLELLRRADEAVTRAQLIDAAWNGRRTESHTVSNCVLKLRNALGAVDGDRIETVPGVGYRLVGPIKRVPVGRKAVSRLNLENGQAVPGRPDMQLYRQLGASFGNEIWLARRRSDATSTIFKFSRNEESLAALKRETSIHRLLVDTFGPRPDFVPLRSWNFHTPPFYIESEYCGENLAEWSTTDHRLENVDSSARLDIFLQVADAVAAAHSVGVLHKDLKPTNIFIAALESGYQVRVGDFGNASLLEPDRLEELGITRMGMTVEERDAQSGLSGTPFYLAPELLLGSPATVRTDIYALGVLLWQIVFEGDCRRPMASGWEVGSNDAFMIEDIKLATAGDPERRLASVPELTARLRQRAQRQRLFDEAQTATQRELQAAKSLEKARLRRPWITISIVAMALGLGASIYLYQAERSARRRSEVDEARVESTNAFLTDMLRRADPTAPGGATHTTIESAIDHAQESLARQFRDDPAIKGSIDLTLGDVFFGQSQYARALGFNQEAYALLNASLGPHHPTTLTAAYKLAGNLDMLSRHQEAKAILDRSDHAAGSLLNSPSPLSFLASSVRGGNYLLQMQAAPALKQFLTSERIRAAIAPDNEEWLVHVRSDIAWCEVRLNRSAEALGSLSLLITPVYSPERIGMAEWMKLHLQYGIALSNVGRYVDAEKELQTAESEAEHRLGANSYLVGLAFNYLATLYKTEGDWTSARHAAESEIQVFSALGPEHQSVVGSAVDKAVIDYLNKPNEQAYRALGQAQETVSRLLGMRSPIAQYANFYLATAALERGELERVSALVATLDPAALASADISPDWPARVDALRGWYILANKGNDEGTRLVQAALATLTDHADPAWMSAPLKKALRDAKAS